MKIHSKAEEVLGTEFKSYNKEKKAKVLEYYGYDDGNHYYLCSVSDSKQTMEKKVQYSNLRSGRFGFKGIYPNRELARVTAKKYDNMQQRARGESGAYANITCKFDSHAELYYFIEDYLKKMPHLYDDFIDGKIEMDKDLLNNLLGKSEYSEDTILLTSSFVNRSTIKKACNIKDKVERESELYKILFDVNPAKFEEVVRSLPISDIVYYSSTQNVNGVNEYKGKLYLPFSTPICEVG